jgi:hypothetical protein
LEGRPSAPHRPPQRTARGPGQTVSHSTHAARAGGLFCIFKLLRSAGFKTGPSGLGGKHIEFLMDYWTADPAIESGLSGAKRLASNPAAC